MLSAGSGFYFLITKDIKCQTEMEMHCLINKDSESSVEVVCVKNNCEVCYYNNNKTLLTKFFRWL